MGGCQQEVKMSEKNELEEARDWEIFETTQCLLSVRLLSVVCLRLKKDSIVWTSSDGFLSGAAEGQLVSWPCCGAPQEDNLSRSLLRPLFPAHQNHQLCFRTAHTVPASAPKCSTLTPILNSIFSSKSAWQKSSLHWYFTPHQCFLLPSPLYSRIYVSSL